MSTATTAPTPEQFAARRRLRRWIVGIAVVLLFPVAVMVLLHIGLASAINDELDAIRAAGEPVSVAELVRPRGEKLADEENAALVYEKAYAAMTTLSEDDNKLVPVIGWTSPQVAAHEPYNEAAMAAAIRYLKANVQAIQLLDLADSMPRAQFFDERMLVGPVFMPIHRAILMRTLQGVIAAEQGDSQAAVTTLLGCQKVADRLAREPQVLITQLVYIAIRGQTVNTAERVCNRVPLSDEQLGQLDTALQGEDRGALEAAMIGERAFTVDQFDEPLSEWLGMGEGPWPVLVAATYRVTGFDKYDHLVCLRKLRGVVQASRQRLPGRLAAARVALASTGEPPYLLLPFADIGGSVERCFQFEVRTETNVRVARVGIAVQRFRLSESRLPESLDEVAVKYCDVTLADPFTGQPLKYKRLDVGFTVYSVGEDGIDNDGAAENADGQSYEPGSDIPFTIRR